MSNIIIDEELKGLLPPLDQKTFELLEENILANGCRDALVLWGNVLVDGHNRYEICTKHDIEFTTVNKDFASREEAMIWIITTQVSRRNLSPIQLSYYRGLHYRADKKILSNAKGINKRSEVGGQNDHQPPDQKTASRLAGQYRVSPKTITRDAQLANALDAIGETSPEAKRRILAGETKMEKNLLQELTAKPKEEIEAVAASIEEGTYEKKKPVPTAPTEAEDGRTDPDRGKSASAGPQRTDTANIIGLTEIFLARLRELEKANDTGELKSELRFFIENLEVLYLRV